MKKAKFFSGVLSVAITSIALAAGSIAAPTYPPSIETPVAGEPIQVPVAPKVAGAVVVVPIAVSADIPAVTKAPVALSAVVKNVNAVVNPTLFDSKPVAPVKDVIVGGIPSSKKDDLPYSVISATSKKKIEIQVAEDVPTTLFIEKLTPRATASVSISVGGKTVRLGTFRVLADGSLELPPLTLGKDGLSITVTVSVGKLTRSFTVRSTN
jgi:hypothetical protein